MNPILENIIMRRSVKSYRPDSVPAELIDQVLEAGLYAASGMNSQETVIVAITNKSVRDRLAKSNAAVMGADMDPFYGAPAVLVVLAKKSRGTGIYDGSLVMGNMMLAAASLGLGSCWIHRAKECFEQQEWKDWLHSIGVEGEYEGIGNCILGYAEGEVKPPLPRKANRVYRVD